MTESVSQYAFTVESEEIFEEWDKFLEAQVYKAKQIFNRRTRYEQSKVPPLNYNPEVSHS